MASRESLAPSDLHDEASWARRIAHLPEHRTTQSRIQEQEQDSTNANIICTIGPTGTSPCLLRIEARILQKKEGLLRR